MPKNDQLKKNKGVDEPVSEGVTEQYLAEEDIAEAIDQSIVSDDAPEREFVSFNRTATIDNSIMAYNRKSSTFFKSSKSGKSDGTQTQIDRFYPDVESGLSNEQVGIRMAQELNNVSKLNKGRTYWNIFASNIFTFFNMLILAVFIAMIVFMEFPKDLSKLFFMAIALANVTIGIVQEIKSKRAADKLTLVTAPVAMVTSFLQVPVAGS